jgi:hypothetical protein
MQQGASSRDSDMDPNCSNRPLPNWANQCRIILRIMTTKIFKAFFVAFAAYLLLVGSAQAQVQVPEPTQNPTAPYRLFRTQNIFTFLLLDTRTGQISQVQWSTDTEKRFVSPLNSRPLVEDGKPGRFTLYPTQNIYTFLLLDQDTGNSWQVQWGSGRDRFIIPID